MLFLPSHGYKGLEEKGMNTLKIAFGMITKDLLTTEPLDQFLNNAHKFNHPIDCVVIGYADQIDEGVVKTLSESVEVHLVKIRNDEVLYQQMREMGIPPEKLRHLIGDHSKHFDGRAAYGRSRNHVIIKAMLEEIDTLIFIDTDVYPEVVIKQEDLLSTVTYQTRQTALKDIYIQEVDFVGNHLDALVDEDVMVTTSDYTGYYIIPPMKFDGMQDLFFGLKKEAAYNYIMDSYHHHCLSTDHGIRRQSFRTDKVLGGNVAIKLKLFKHIVPFYSSTFEVEGNKYLTRGEDTVLAIQMKKEKHMKFVDIDMKIFHNTYSHFPTIPDILKDKPIKDRFYYAAMGWIGRNPFLNDIRGIDVKKAYRLEHENLIRGADAIARYLEDDRFLKLPKAHDIAYGRLEDMKMEFQLFKDSWFEFIRRLQ